MPGGQHNNEISVKIDVGIWRQNRAAVRTPTVRGNRRAYTEA
jgi:hypothetical protein